MRFRKALFVLEEVNGGDRISQTEIGHRVAQRLGTGRSGNAVSEWWTGKSIPDTPAMAALADVLGVDPGWLEFGPMLCDAPQKWPVPGKDPTGGAGPADDYPGPGDEGQKKSG